MPTQRPEREAEEGSSHFPARLVDWSTRRGGQRPTPPDNGEAVCPPPRELCTDPQLSDGPEQSLSFRSSVSLIDPRIDIVLGDPVEGLRPLAYSCARVVDATAHFALDLRFQQEWFFQSKVFGALSTSIAIAPGEQTTLTIRNTQRKLFDQTTLDQAEKATETESTVSDKDVMNVARSSSRTNNWSLSSEASFGLGDLSVGGSGSVSQTVTNTANSSAERVQESTSKSSEQLKTLHKVEVRELIETTTEAGRTRVMLNPYRDRSLRLDIYELRKLYCVTFSLAGIVPCITIDVRSLEFDEHFVRTNGSFLAACMMDETLAAELAQALALADQVNESVDRRERAGSLALLALGYLFGPSSVFGYTQQDNDQLVLARTLLGANVPSGWDENDPANSFVSPLANWSGTQDAVRNTSTLAFTTLAMYHRLYKDEVLGGLGTANRQLAIELATSLESALGPLWTSAEGTGPVTGLTDLNDATEVFRRLAGFLTFVSGVLRPLLQSSDEASAGAGRRARFVLERVVEHLNCHRRYYTERFIWYMAEKSHSRTLTEFARELLEEHLLVDDAAVLALFDPNSALLDKSCVIIPFRQTIPLDDLPAVIGTTSPHEGPHLGVIDRRMITVPTDGWHIEPATGICVLENVPPPTKPTPIHLAVEHSPDARLPMP